LHYNETMKKIRIIYSLFVIVLGVSMFVYGGYDDSPGGQLLGLVVVIFGIVGIVKSRKKGSTDQS
jgi:hypothetical protein